MSAVRRPDPQFENVLIGNHQAPPDPDLDPQVQAVLALEIADNQAALLAQRIQEGGQPVETAPMAENHSVTQTPQVEPNFLERVWQIVSFAFETLVSCIFSFFSWISGGRESSSEIVSSNAAPTSVAPIAAPAAAPGRDPAHFAKDLFLRVWNHFENGGTADEIQNLVTLSSQSDRTDFPEIQENPIELVTRADYRGIGSVDVAAYANQRYRMCGALLTKGAETHLLFINTRSGTSVYYLFSYPNGVVQANELHNFTNEVTQRVPIDANLPFNLQRLSFVQNQNQNQ